MTQSATGTLREFDPVQSTSILLASPKQTRRFGNALAKTLPRQAIALFSGDLAAGKTTLIRAIVEGLGVHPDLVTSPTYTIANWYEGTDLIYHVDLYRLEQTADLHDMDPDDWLNPSGPTFIEWPEIALPLLRGLDYLRFQLNGVVDEPTARLVKLSADSAAYADALAFVKAHAADEGQE